MSKREIRGPEVRRLDSIKGYEQNAKIHTDATLAALTASIKEFGYAIPAIIDEAGVLLAGHGRVEAARRAGLTEVPVLIVVGWSEIEKKEYRLFDNRAADMSHWDEARLKSALAALKDMQFNFEAIGFKPPEDSRRGEHAGEGLDGNDQDDEPARTKTGDIWKLGQHRLICGDSTNDVVVAAVLDGRLARLMVTDPPYGVEYDDTWRTERLKPQVVRGKLANDDRSDWSGAFKHFTGPTAYSWYSSTKTTSAAAALTANRFEIEANIVWAKNKMCIGMGWLHWRHECCLYAERRGQSPNGLESVWHGDDEQSLWMTDSHRAHGAHPSIKPLECMAVPMKNSSNKGDVIYEPFAGSGTTIIAAEGGGRICCAVEIDPKFVDLAIERWEESGGDKAVKL